MMDVVNKAGCGHLVELGPAPRSLVSLASSEPVAREYGQ